MYHGNPSDAQDTKYPQRIAFKPVVFTDHSVQAVDYSSEGSFSGPWLDPDAVVHRRQNPLGAAGITFSSLHGNVPKQELNVLQLAARKRNRCQFLVQRAD